MEQDNEIQVTLEKLSLQDGDILQVKFKRLLPAEHMQQMLQGIKDMLDGNNKKVCLIGMMDGIDFESVPVEQLEQLRNQISAVIEEAKKKAGNE